MANEKNVLPENLFDELVEFIKVQTRAFDIDIMRDTLIEDDLGVTGDDASDLLENLSKNIK
jgi:hypothetical protein